MCHEPMMHLNGAAPNPRSEYPISMSCNLHVVGERCSSAWLTNGDLCPLCEADKAKALAAKEAVEKQAIETARVEQEEQEKAAAAETINSDEANFDAATPSVAAANDHESTVKGMFLHIFDHAQY